MHGWLDGIHGVDELVAGLIATVQERVLAPGEPFSVESSLFGVQFEYALVRVPLVPHLSVVAHSTLHS